MPVVFLLLKKIKIYLAVLGLHCCMHAFSSSVAWVLLYLQCWSLSLQSFLVAEHELQRHLGFSNWWCSGSVALRHVGSSWTRDGTHVPGVARQSLNHRATREAQMSALYGNSGSLPALGDGRAGAGSSAMKPHM